MRDAALGVAVQHRKMGVEFGRDVVGIEDRDLGGPREAFAAHHQNVDVGDGQDRRRPVRRRRYRPNRPWLPAVGRGMARQERRQMRFDADRSHAGAAAALRAMSDGNVWRQYADDNSQYNDASAMKRYGYKVRRRIEVSTALPLPDLSNT